MSFEPRRGASAMVALELLADRVGERADLGPILAGQLADAGKQLAQLTLAAEVGRSRPASSSAGSSASATAASARPRRSSSWAEKDSRSTAKLRRYLDRATSAMLANVAASRTAMSARILRSSSTPADFNPLMSLA